MKGFEKKSKSIVKNEVVKPVVPVDYNQMKKIEQRQPVNYNKMERLRDAMNGFRLASIVTAFHGSYFLALMVAERGKIPEECPDFIKAWWSLAIVHGLGLILVFIHPLI